MIQKVIDRYRYSFIILNQIVRTDFKLRYQGSILGYTWSLLKPLFLFLITYIVFVKILRVDYGVPNSGAYLLLGIVIYSFFSEVTGGGVGAVVGKGDLFRKLNFPRYSVVIATTLSALINLALSMIVVFAFIIFGGASFHPSIFIAPILFLELFIFSLGIALFLSAMFVRLRDVGHVWDVVLQALFYATPILFPVTLAPFWLQKIIMLNPLAQIIQDLRYLFISDKTTTIATIYSSGYIRLVPVTFVFIVFILGALYFKKRSPYFAEEI